MNQQLTTHQMRRITSYLNRRGIVDEGLILEMTEHVKGLVILYRNSGTDFDAAFTRAIAAMKARESLTGFPRRAYTCTRADYRDTLLPPALGLMALLILLAGLYLQYYALPFGHLLLITGALVLAVAFLLALSNLVIPVITGRFNEAFLR